MPIVTKLYSVFVCLIMDFVCTRHNVPFERLSNWCAGTSARTIPHVAVRLEVAQSLLVPTSSLCADLCRSSCMPHILWRGELQGR